MWRKYFGDSATIFGIDINPNCYKHNGVHGEVRIGSQDDKEFLESVVDEMGGIDIVLDDGSHKIHHIKRTLDILFPHLTKEGIYFIEDLHASYWANFGGGYNSKNNFFRNIVIDLINDMHRWYHFHSLKMEHISKDCSGIHIHDSILVLEKNKTFFPQHSEQFSPSYTTSLPTSSGPEYQMLGALLPALRRVSTTGNRSSRSPPVSRTLVMP